MPHDLCSSTYEVKNASSLTMRLATVATTSPNPVVPVYIAAWSLVSSHLRRAGEFRSARATATTLLTVTPTKALRRRRARTGEFL